MGDSGSGWSVDTAKADLETQIQGVRDSLKEANLRHQQRFEAQEKAIDKEASSNEKRFAAVNEFRGSLTDQAATFARKDQVDVQVKALDDKIGTLSGVVNSIAGRAAGATSTWSYIPTILAAMAALIAIGSFVFR